MLDGGANVLVVHGFNVISASMMKEDIESMEGVAKELARGCSLEKSIELELGMRKPVARKVVVESETTESEQEESEADTKKRQRRMKQREKRKKARKATLKPVMKKKGKKKEVNEVEEEMTDSEQEPIEEDGNKGKGDVHHQESGKGKSFQRGKDEGYYRARREFEWSFNSGGKKGNKGYQPWNQSGGKGGKSNWSKGGKWW